MRDWPPASMVHHGDDETQTGMDTDPAGGGGALRPAPAPVAAPPAIAAGDAIGRYQVRGPLGAGGMGEVFLAHDPTLDREIALKLLNPEIAGSSAAARARFQREAQAMARLSHPNVVAVYDVLAIAERVVVAMELVRGPTLKDWLADAPRGWREVVRAMVEAGRGLEAAHDAGMVHRDFKPSNVLVGDRIKVADFGLARGSAAEDVETGEAPSVVLDATVTASGEALGTLAYMAPELRRRLPATPASDQYAFAVTLYEALYGVRPGGGQVPSRSVPRWLRAIVTRGLADRPADRYPSMHALLADLVGIPARRRRWRAGAAVLGVAAMAAVLARTAATVEAPCRDARPRLAGIWDPGRRVAIASAFAATGLPNSGETWERARRVLDDYASGWVAMHEEACRATRLEGRQSEHVLDLRMACLDRRRAILDALTAPWTHQVTPQTLRVAVDAAQRLDPLGECADVRALTEPARLPTEAIAFARVRAVEARIDFAWALLLARRWPESWAAAVAARRDADAVGWPHLVAEAAYLEGRAANNLDEPPATPFFVDAIRLATESRDDTLLAKAYVDLVRYDSNIATYAQQALLLADLAAGAVARAGNEPRVVARLRSARAEAFLSLEKMSDAEAAFRSAHDELARAYGPLDPDALIAESNRARVLRRTGNYRAARELQEQVLEQTTRRLGPLHPNVATLLQNLGIAATDLGDRDGAARYLERSLAIQEQVLGPEAGATALTLASFAVLNLERGRLADAVAQFRRALAIEERVFGGSSEEVATALVGFAVALRKLGELEDSRQQLERARTAFAKVFGRDHASVATVFDHLGELREASGDPAGALADFDQALAIRTKTLGADHPMTLASVAQRARVLAATGRCREVRADLARAIAGFTKLAAGDDNSVPDLADALAVEARCATSNGRLDPAIAELERALHIKQHVHAPDVEQGVLRWQLAQLRWQRGQRDEALADARQAQQQLAADRDGARARAELVRWLGARGVASGAPR